MVLSHRHGCESTKSIQCVSTQDNDAWVKDETFFCLPLYPFYVPYFMVFLLPLSSSSPLLLKLHLSPVLYILSHLTFFFFKSPFLFVLSHCPILPRGSKKMGVEGEWKGREILRMRNSEWCAWYPGLSIETTSSSGHRLWLHLAQRLAQNRCAISISWYGWLLVLISRMFLQIIKSHKKK